MSAAQDDRERRLARRRLVRELHPDRGGDPAVYLAALAEFDARHPAAVAPEFDGGGEVVLVRSARWRWPSRLRRRLREHRRRGWASL